MLDVQTNIECEPLAIRPMVIGALNNGRIIVAAVFFELHLNQTPIFALFMVRQHGIGGVERQEQQTLALALFE